MSACRIVFSLGTLVVASLKVVCVEFQEPTPSFALRSGAPSGTSSDTPLTSEHGHMAPRIIHLPGLVEIIPRMLSH